jgi:hypothetical protein
MRDKEIAENINTIMMGNLYFIINLKTNESKKLLSDIKKY